MKTAYFGHFFRFSSLFYVPIFLKILSRFISLSTQCVQIVSLQNWPQLIDCNHATIVRDLIVQSITLADHFMNDCWSSAVVVEKFWKSSKKHTLYMPRSSVSSDISNSLGRAGSGYSQKSGNISIYPYIYLNIHFPIYLSIHLPVYPSFHLPIYLSIHLTIYLAL